MTRAPRHDPVTPDTPLRHAAPYPVVTGVYLLFLRCRLEYIGRSKNCYARIEEHRRNGREFDYASVMALPEADMTWIEAELIRSLDARKNRSGVPQKAANGAPAVRLVERVVTREVPTTIEPVLVSVAEAQRIAGQHFRSLSGAVWRAAKDGSLPTITVPIANSVGPTSKRVRTADLSKWIEARLAELGATPTTGDAP